MNGLAFDPWAALAKLREARTTPPNPPNPPNLTLPPPGRLGALGGLGGEQPATPEIIAAPLVMLAQVPPAADWWTLPFGQERGEALTAAREAPGACFSCAGRGRWRLDGEAGAGICWTCHPPPPGLSAREVLT